MILLYQLHLVCLVFGTPMPTYTGKNSHKHRPDWAPLNVKLSIYAPVNTSHKSGVRRLQLSPTVLISMQPTCHKFGTVMPKCVGSGV